MNSIEDRLFSIRRELPQNSVLVAVSKTRSNEDILKAYQAGQRDFGENKVQELTIKAKQLPKDIKWHMIGHLQRNKVKYIAPFVHLIHGVDSLKLLKEIAKQGEKNNRVMDCLLQVHIAEEETKFGFSPSAIKDFLLGNELHEWRQVRIMGLMTMATYTSDKEQIAHEFRLIKELFDWCVLHQPKHVQMTILSTGMSADYKIALENGSNMIRIGSAIFGPRNH